MRHQSPSRHHEHRHADLTLATPGHDLNMLGVILHVLGDAVNNIGVMVAAIAIWKAKSDARFYADPAVSLFIAIMIFASAVPLVKNSGSILLQSAPLGVDLKDIQHDLEKVSSPPRSRIFIASSIKDSFVFSGNQPQRWKGLSEEHELNQGTSRFPGSSPSTSSTSGA